MPQAGKYTLHYTVTKNELHRFEIKQTLMHTVRRVQWRTVEISAMHWWRVMQSALQLSSVQFSAVHYSSAKGSTVKPYTAQWVSLSAPVELVGNRFHEHWGETWGGNVT